MDAAFAQAVKVSNEKGQFGNRRINSIEYLSRHAEASLKLCFCVEWMLPEVFTLYSSNSVIKIPRNIGSSSGVGTPKLNEVCGAIGLHILYILYSCAVLLVAAISK